MKLLLKEPLAHRYGSDLATAARVSEVIEREFGVQYYRDYVGRLMHGLAWTHQKPEARAAERDEEAIEGWKRQDWPRVKETLRGWAPTWSSPTKPDSY